MAKRLLILGLVLAALVAGQTLWHIVLGDEPSEWYVDSVHGSDDNSGISQGLAFATIAKLESVFADGDTVRPVRGSHWREQLTITEDDVTIEAVGTGEKPLFDASDIIAAESWSKTAAQTNVYEASVPIDYEAAKTYVAAWVDDVRLTRVADLATCDLTAGSYLPSAENTSPITLYVHLPDSDDPGSNGETVEYTARRHAIIATGASKSISGIAGRRGLHNDGVFNFGPGATVTDVEASGCGYHCVAVAGGSTLTALVTSDSRHSATASSQVVVFAGVGSGSVVFNNPTIGNPEFRDGVVGINCHTNSGAFDSITINGGTFTNLENPFGATGGDLLQATITGITATGLNWGFPTVYVPLTISDSTIALYVNSTGRGLDIAAAVAVVVDNVHFTGGSTGSGKVFSLTASGGSLTMTDSTVDTFNVVLNWGTQTNPTASMLRNTYDVGGYEYKLPTTHSVTSDYNVFTDSIQKMSVNAADKTLTEWTCLSGQDANSTPAPGACE